MDVVDVISERQGLDQHFDVPGVAKAQALLASDTTAQREEDERTILKWALSRRGDDEAEVILGQIGHRQP